MLLWRSSPLVVRQGREVRVRGTNANTGATIAGGVGVSNYRSHRPPGTPALSYNGVLQSDILPRSFALFISFSRSVFFFLIHRRISGPGLSPWTFLCLCVTVTAVIRQECPALPPRPPCSWVKPPSRPSSSETLAFWKCVPADVVHSVHTFDWLASTTSRVICRYSVAYFLGFRVCKLFYVLLLLPVKGNIYFAICWAHKSKQMCWQKCFLLLFREENTFFSKNILPINNKFVLPW